MMKIASDQSLEAVDQKEINRIIWKCRVCGCEVEGDQESPVCAYDSAHGHMDHRISLSLKDHHNIRYGRPAR